MILQKASAACQVTDVLPTSVVGIFAQNWRLAKKEEVGECSKGGGFISLLMSINTSSHEVYIAESERYWSRVNYRMKHQYDGLLTIINYYPLSGSKTLQNSNILSFITTDLTISKSNWRFNFDKMSMLQVWKSINIEFEVRMLRLTLEIEILYLKTRLINTR